MVKDYTYELIENGYNIYVAVGGSKPSLALHQPEPFIIYRVTNKQNETDYALSAQAHIQAMSYEDTLPKEQDILDELKTENESLNAQLSAMADVVDYLVMLSLGGE